MRREIARLALAIALLAPLPGFAALRAEGGVRLIEAFESAPANVVAQVLDTRQLDAHAWAGTLVVETALSGLVPRGARVPIAWEELATGRQPRFAPGERILVALEPLPGASIWLGRIPDPRARSATLAPAQRGDAFLRSPSPETVLLLEHYLALASEPRAGAAGADYLADLAAQGDLPVALSAVTRLRTHSGLDAELGPEPAQRLVDALLRPDAAPKLSEAIVALVGSRHLQALRKPLESVVARDTLAPAPVYAALAALDDGLPPERTQHLLRSEAARREVAARFARGPGSESLLAQLIRRDPDAGVRRAAVERLLELRGRGAVGDVAAALYDSEPGVRASAAQGLGSLGSAAVPELQRVAQEGDRSAAQAAVAGLLLTGSPEGKQALARIAREHPDEAIRKLARVALGEPIGHGD